MDIPRGKYIGRHLGDQPVDEAEHFMRCPACGGWMDCRDLAQILEHEGPLPHPAEDQPLGTPLLGPRGPRGSCGQPPRGSLLFCQANLWVA